MAKLNYYIVYFIAEYVISKEPLAIMVAHVREHMIQRYTTIINNYAANVLKHYHNL